MENFWFMEIGKTSCIREGKSGSLKVLKVSKNILLLPTTIYLENNKVCDFHETMATLNIRIPEARKTSMVLFRCCHIDNLDYLQWKITSDVTQPRHFMQWSGPEGTGRCFPKYSYEN